jgi:hypothetical protein
MAATQLLFHHELVNGGEPLIVVTGADEIAWSYALNVAEFPTYGGEVVQILSVYIDDVTVEGTVRQYSEAEEIYEFFMQYFTIATQGSSAASADKYSQVPMIMEYAHRGWRFEIQPLEAPGFMYSLETVTPKWQLKAHMVDKTPDVSKLQNLVVQELVNKEKFNLKGTISPESGDPAQNPFIAPGTFLGDKFVEATAKQAAEGVTKIGDYYNSLLPSYLNDTFFQDETAVGAKPNFGNEGKGETPTTTLPGAKVKSNK